MPKFFKSLEKKDIDDLRKTARLARRDILTMTTLAQSGHPGGSMSIIDMMLLLYKCANINPNNINDPLRDRIIVSDGHLSPAMYTTLGRYGFINLDEAKAYFRLAGSIFEGHIERDVPGIEWSSGNLGQGLSAAAGFAVAGRLKKEQFNIFVFMGDGEQQKGQISESRRFIYKYGFNNICVLIDYNKLQISGSITEVMPQNIRAEYEADGWTVLEINGHNFEEIYEALQKSFSIETPVLILAHTIMGKGVSFMENKEKYHGAALPEDLYKKAAAELGLDDELEKYRQMRKDFNPNNCNSIKTKHKIFNPSLNIEVTSEYSVDTKLDNRSAFGNALCDVMQKNYGKNNIPIIVFDCDLASSTKTDKFATLYKDNFFECGIQEHHTATTSGACSINDTISIFADFGVFGIDEVYNQLRLNDINNTHLKLVTTHVGLDVGEDGKTHQCIDYLGVLRNLYNFKIIVPADPNQTDRAFRYMINNEGNFLLAMGRSKVEILKNDNESPFFGKNYEFEYGKIDILREGKIALLTYGSMVQYALKVANILKEKNVNLAVINISCPLSINLDELKKYIEKGIMFTYEDHNINTGLFSIVAENIIKNGLSCKVVPFGIKKYGFSGKPVEILKLMKLDPENISKSIIDLIQSYN